MTPRGIRNHNPGNILDSGIKWDGLTPPGKRTGAQVQEGKFCVFNSPWWGIRALAKVLLRYYSHHGLKTVKGMINRYAPEHENPTNNYIDAVANSMGVKPTTQLLLTYYTLESLCGAIIEFENGSNPYTWEIATGIIMAGVEPKAHILSDGQLRYDFKD